MRGSRLFTAALYSYKVLIYFEVVLGICVDHIWCIPLKGDAVQLSMVQFTVCVAVPPCAEQCFKVARNTSAVPLSECSIIAHL